jgi:SET domain-containing protein
MNTLIPLDSESLNHLVNNIKTEIKPSSIQGVGVFAIRDIKEGEQLFPKWEGETGIYIIPNESLDKLPNYILNLMYRYFINYETEFKLIRLFNGFNFISHNLSYCNSAYPNKEKQNIDNKGFALRDIGAGEEILEWYEKNINLDNSK